MTAPSYSKIIQYLLHRLGITEQYTGFFQAVYAVQLSIGDVDRLRLVTKLIYPEVAGRYGTTWMAVERNMRTIISIAWDTDPLLLSELAGFPLNRKPTNTHFLAILTYFCTRIIM